MISDHSVQYFFRTNSCQGKRALNCFFYIQQIVHIIEPYILTFVSTFVLTFVKNNSRIICVEKATQCFFQKCMRNYRKKLPQKITTKNYHNITTNRPTIEYTRKLIPPNHPATPPKKKFQIKVEQHIRNKSCLSISEGQEHIAKAIPINEISNFNIQFQYLI